jgi:YndJ-like protein
LAIAKMDLAVGGAWMMASRLGMRPMGIQEPIGLLTAVHFHFAGFATATIAAATLRFAKLRHQDRYLKYVVGMVAIMPLVVAAGFVISPAVKMGAALGFSASVAALAIFVRAAGRKVQNTHAHVLLQISAGAVFVGMIFAAAYAVGDFAGSEVLTIPQMARTHGIFNAVGFCLPGLLGWILSAK